MAFIAGGYTAVYNSVTIGQVESGFRIDHSLFKRLIIGDNFAEGPQDAVNRGAAVFCSFAMMNWDTVVGSAALRAIWPYGSSYLDHTEAVGKLDVGSSLVKSLVLTAITATPAAANPATLTLTNAILAENFNVSILFAPDLRTMPVRMRAYPSQSAIINGTWQDATFGALT